jgi:nicotinamide phosphoribosyltransferase
MPGFSIPAAEHSTITAWGRKRELEAYANMLRAYPDSPLVAVVSDSYGVFARIGAKAGRLKLVRINGEHTTVAEDNPGSDEMVEVFRDGELLKEWTFDEVRERAALTS